jgi:hypothetical protein
MNNVSTLTDLKDIKPVAQLTILVFPSGSGKETYHDSTMKYDGDAVILLQHLMAQINSNADLCEASNQVALAGLSDNIQIN